MILGGQNRFSKLKFTAFFEKGDVFLKLAFYFFFHYKVLIPNNSSQSALNLRKKYEQFFYFIF